MARCPSCGFASPVGGCLGEEPFCCGVCHGSGVAYLDKGKVSDARLLALLCYGINQLRADLAPLLRAVSGVKE